MRRQGILNNLDWLTISIYMALTIIGIVFIFSTTHDGPESSLFDFNASSGKQIVWFGLSIIVAIFLLIIDVKFYSTFAYLIYGGIMLMLVAVLFFGVTINGSKSWFAIGSIRFQPAELAKFATSLALAKYLTGLNVNLKNIKDKLLASGVVGFPIFLILLQGDVGSALVFAGFVFVLHREGLESIFLVVGSGFILFSLLALLYNPTALISFYIAVLLVFIYYRKKDKYPIVRPIVWIAAMLGATILYYSYYPQFFPEAIVSVHYPILSVYLVLLVGGSIKYMKQKNWIAPILALLFMVSVYTISVDYIFNNIFKQHHRDRIDLILGKIEDRSGVGYNLFQSKIAIGSGGLLGKGYLKGTQTKFNFVPEQNTDFIFTSIAEELGFLGSFLVIGLYCFLLLRIIALADRQRSKFARIYGYGVACILFIHFAINISMTIGLMPVIGIPLPFVSYGGSSLLAFTILLAVLLKLDTERLSAFR